MLALVDGAVQASAQVDDMYRGDSLQALACRLQHIHRHVHALHAIRAALAEAPLITMIMRLQSAMLPHLHDVCTSAGVACWQRRRSRVVRLGNMPGCSGHSHTWPPLLAKGSLLQQPDEQISSLLQGLDHHHS